MGKSFSNKKKTSKYSRQGRAKKKSKTRRTRSKKLRRRDDLVAYSSNDSRSSVSDSSSSEDKYRSRRSWSRSRKDVKGTKRRVRLCSSSSEESHCMRKRKGSRRDDDSEVRKKILRNKKKVQRDASISSRSSGPLSCSTCRSSSSSSSDESEYERLRGRSERREKNVRKLKNDKSGTKKRRYKSRSCSSCSRHNGSNVDWSEEKASGGNISKRLKSVITHTKEDKEGTEFTWDEHKEEIYDHDDYPSSRSNDSNDGGNKSVSAHQSHSASERARPIEIEKREDASVCNIKTTKLPDSYKDWDDQYVRSKPSCVGVGKNDAVEEKNKEMSEPTGSVNGDDLESILRQKALENLRRFRGGFQTNAMNAVNKKGKSDGALKSLSTTKCELSQTESPQDDGAQGVMENSAHSMKKDEKLLDEKNSGNESVSANKNAHLPNHVAVYSRDKLVSGINKPGLVASALKQALLNTTTTAIEVHDSWVSNKAKLVTRSSASKNNGTPLSGNSNDDKINNASGSASCCATAGDVFANKLKDEGKEGSSMVPLNNSSNGGAVNNASGSSSVEPFSHIASAARDISLNKEQDDGKEGSQLEQKTMSVMRGGEMVQVSYKVYIPKKAPALARRQLKR